MASGRESCWALPVLPGRPVLPLAQLEKQAILETLRKLNGDKLLAARLLGIGKTTLYRKLKEYGIGAPEAEDHAGNEDSAAPAYNDRSSM